MKISNWHNLRTQHFGYRSILKAGGAAFFSNCSFWGTVFVYILSKSVTIDSEPILASSKRLYTLHKERNNIK